MPDPRRRLNQKSDLVVFAHLVFPFMASCSQGKDRSPEIKYFPTFDRQCTGAQIAFINLRTVLLESSE